MVFPDVGEERFGSFTVRAAGSDEDLKGGRRLFCLHGDSDEADEEEYTADRRPANQSGPACVPMAHRRLTDDVKRSYGPDIGQDVQHLLIRQLASKAVHRAEEHAVGNGDEQLPIGFRPRDR
jgi:hypothetical protein